MKILFVTPTEINHSSGSAMRSRHLLDALSTIGRIHVLQVARGNAVSIGECWDDHGRRWANYTLDGFSPAAIMERRKFRALVGALLAEEGFDLIVVRYPGTALLVPPAMLSRLIIDADDAFKFPPSGGGISLLGRLKLRIRNHLVRRLCGRAAHAWFVHPLDARMMSGDRKSLLGNVIDIPETVALDLVGHPRILMAGWFHYAPNADGLRWFVRHVLPSLREWFPTIELRVVGRAPPTLSAELADRSITFLGFVDDISVEYGRASLVVAPIFVGAGTQIKVIDALAHGRPLVATELAHSGFAQDLQHDVHLVVANDAEGWIRACRLVLQDRAGAEQMAQRGRDAVRVFDAGHMASRVRDTLASLRLVPAWTRSVNP